LQCKWRSLEKRILLLKEGGVQGKKSRGVSKHFIYGGGKECGGLGE